MGKEGLELAVDSTTHHGAPRLLQNGLDQGIKGGGWVLAPSKTQQHRWDARRLQEWKHTHTQKPRKGLHVNGVTRA
jgi:hypothetical protein